MKAEEKPRLRSFSIAATVDVDIDPDELHEEGWHHESECGVDADKDPEAAALDGDDIRALGSALASLHRQAHPTYSLTVGQCHEEPCRSLSLDQLAAVTE